MKNSLFIDTSIYFIVNIFITIGSIALIPIYTSYLGPEDWGYIAIFLFFGPTVAGLVSLGLPQASYYFYFKLSSIHDYNKLHSTNFYLLIIIYLAIGSLTYFFSMFIS